MKSNHKLQLAGVIIGSLFTLAPVIASGIGVLRAASLLKHSGISDTQGFADRLGVTLYSMLGVMIFCPIGLVILAVTATAYFNGKKSDQREKSALPPPLPQV